MWNKIKVFFKSYGLKLLFWFLVITVIVLATINIRLAFLLDGKFGNVFTAISGWVSFLATILVGHIAYKQNREYKLENDKFIQEQKNMMWRQNQYNHLSMFIEQIISYKEKLEKFSLINSDELLDNISNEYFVYRYKVKYIERFKNFRDNLLSLLKLSGLYFDETEKVLNLSDRYLANLQSCFENSSNSEFFDVINGNLNDIYDSLFTIIIHAESVRTAVYTIEIKTIKKEIRDLNKRYQEWVSEVKDND